MSSDKDFSASSGSEYSPDGQNNVIGEEIVKTDLPSEERPAKKLAFKRPYKEKPVIEDDRYILHSIINPKNGSKNVAKTLQDLSEAQMTSNNLKEQQLIVEKNRNEIFSHFLTIFKNMTEKNYLNNSSRAAAGAASACASSSPSGSLSTSMYHNSRKLEVDEDRPTTFKHSRTKECYNNDHPEGDVNWLTDLEIEEKKIEIDERRLKLEERKLIMEGQMKERKIALDEKKLKLEGQKANSEDQPEERKLEIDEAQMKFNDQKFMLEVQIEERKLEIDEKRLKLEKRKMYLMEQKKLCNGK